MIHRVFNVRPGFNCGFKGTQCEHTPKGDHGICSDKWIFTVIDRDAHAALELTVSTPYYPKTVANGYNTSFTGDNLGFHFGYPTSRPQVIDRPDSDSCSYIGTCYNAGSWGLRADELVKAVGCRSEVGLKDPLWAALEVELHECIIRAELARREDGDLKWAKCGCCAGTGTVEVKR